MHTVFRSNIEYINKISYAETILWTAGGQIFPALFMMGRWVRHHACAGLSVVKAEEPIRIQTLRSEASVECFDARTIRWIPWPAEV